MADLNHPGAFKARTPDVEIQEGTLCPQCSSGEFTLHRKDPQGTNHRLKCLGCKFQFNADDARALYKQLQKADPNAAEGAAEPEQIRIESVEDVQKATVSAPKSRSIAKQPIPRTPKYLFVTKDRKEHVVVGTKQFKKTVLEWEQRGKYEVFELVPKKMDVKIAIA